ncbi:MAG: VCBS repeat-containing protein [Planctomycetes bacterium]|nr:VCBS repeat-containing protein [Planctomycetota bacterium]
MNRFRIVTLVVATLAASSLGLAQNLSTIAFFPAGCANYSGSAIAKAGGDLDGDGDDDLVLMSQNTADLSILFNNYPAPARMSAQIPIPIFGRWAAVGDMDGDGVNDIVTLSFSNPTLSVILQQTTGWVRTDYPIPGIPEHIRLVDLEGDGDLDVVVGNGTILLNNGTSALSAAVVHFAGSGDALAPSSVIADIDGDGDMDFVREAPPAGFGTTRHVFLELNDGNLGWTTSTLWISNLTPVVLGVGDINGDGLKDIIELKDHPAHGGAIVRTYRQGPGLTFVSGPFVDTFIGPAGASPGHGYGRALVNDFDGDGFDDIGVFPIHSHRLQVLKGRASGEPFPVFASPVHVSQNRVLWSDVDMDGDLDLLQFQDTPFSAASTQMCLTLNLSTPSPGVTQSVVPDGLPVHRQFLGDPFANVGFTVVDATGAGVPFATVFGVASDLSGNSSAVTLTTDASGHATFVPPVASVASTLRVLIGGPMIEPLVIPLLAYGFVAGTNLVPAQGAPFAFVNFTQGHGVPVPFVLAGDLPPAAPTPTIFGDLYTSILSPSPTFVAFDGLGLFGAPNPSAVANPTFQGTWNIPPGVPPGMTMVLQVYLLDPFLQFPSNVMISSPRVITF